MIEVELKYQLTAASLAWLHMHKAGIPGFDLGATEAQHDCYYDTAQFLCFRQALFLRIRNQVRFDIKYHESDDPFHRHCIEKTFPFSTTSPTHLHDIQAVCTRFLPDWQSADTISALLAKNNLHLFADIRKKRTCYTSRLCTLYVDQVEGLGTFLEIETHCQRPEDIPETEVLLQRIGTQIHLPELQPVTQGYVELWLSLYQPGCIEQLSV